MVLLSGLTLMVRTTACPMLWTKLTSFLKQMNILDSTLWWTYINKKGLPDVLIMKSLPVQIKPKKISVANFWHVCSARSTEKIGSWRKTSAAHFISCFCWRLQRFLTQNMTIKFVKGLLYLYKLYKILSKIHNSKSSAPFLPFLGKSAEYSAADFLGRSYF
jgi:hypothetical protein